MRVHRWLLGGRWGSLVFGLLLALGTLAAYWPVRHCDFVNLDDPLYVYQTPMVRQGLTWPGVIWAFHCVKGGNWNPVVWLSHMADCQLYGVTPGGHHVTNLLLHAANVLLLFLVLNKDERGGLAERVCGRDLRLASPARGIRGVGFRTEGRAEHVLLDADASGPTAATRRR